MTFRTQINQLLHRSLLPPKYMESKWQYMYMYMYWYNDFQKCDSIFWTPLHQARLIVHLRLTCFGVDLTDIIHTG